MLYLQIYTVCIAHFLLFSYILHVGLRYILKGDTVKCYRLYDSMLYISVYFGFRQYKAVVSSLPSILRSSLEREMNEMFSKVKAELVLATGPRKTTKISYSRLKQQVV